MYYLAQVQYLRIPPPRTMWLPKIKYFLYVLLFDFHYTTEKRRLCILFNHYLLLLGFFSAFADFHFYQYGESEDKKSQ